MVIEIKQKKTRAKRISVSVNKPYWFRYLELEGNSNDRLSRKTSS